jgi:glucose/arabinose dehydrogenase
LILRGSGAGADARDTFLAGLDTPSGMGFADGQFWFADLKGVYRLPYQPGDRQARQKPQPVTRPGALGSTGGHITRILALDPDGRHFTVSDGSSGNLAEDRPPRATVQIFEKDGGGQRTLASGTRNPVGTQFYPGSRSLWAVVNERDGLGDNLVPDYLASMSDGAFYGWPYSYIGRHPQPGFEGHADLVAKARVPELLFRSHSAPLGLVFVSDQTWPQRYRGGALVALHGSWNSATPTGYFVAFVPFRNGQPTGSYEPLHDRLPARWRRGRQARQGARLGPAGRARLRARRQPVRLRRYRQHDLEAAPPAALTREPRWHRLGLCIHSYSDPAAITSGHWAPAVPGWGLNTRRCTL